MYEIILDIFTHIFLGCTFPLLLLRFHLKVLFSVLQHQQLSEEYMEFSADILEMVNVSRKAGGHVFCCRFSWKKARDNW